MKLTISLISFLFSLLSLITQQTPNYTLRLFQELCQFFSICPPLAATLIHSHNFSPQVDPQGAEVQMVIDSHCADMQMHWGWLRKRGTWLVMASWQHNHSLQYLHITADMQEHLVLHRTGGKAVSHRQEALRSNFSKYLRKLMEQNIQRNIPPVVLGRNGTGSKRYTCIIAHDHTLRTDKQYDEGKQFSTNFKN